MLIGENQTLKRRDKLVFGENTVVDKHRFGRIPSERLKNHDHVNKCTYFCLSLKIIISKKAILYTAIAC